MWPVMGVCPVAVKLRVITVKLYFTWKVNPSNGVFRSYAVIVTVMYHEVVESVIVGQGTLVYNHFGLNVWSYLENNASSGVFYSPIYLMANIDRRGRDKLRLF